MIKHGMKEILKMALVTTGFIVFIFVEIFCLLGLIIFISTTGSVILTILSIILAIFVFTLSFAAGLLLL